MSLHLRGFRTEKPFRDPGWANYPNPDPAFYHVVCHVGDQCIDLSPRHLDVTAPIPVISSLDEIRKEWIAIGISWNAIETVIDLETNIQQSGAAWIQEHMSSLSDPETQEFLWNRVKDVGVTHVKILSMLSTGELLQYRGPYS